MNLFKFGEFVGWTCSIVFATLGVTMFGLKADLVLYILSVISMFFARRMRGYVREVERVEDEVDDLLEGLFESDKDCG